MRVEFNKKNLLITVSMFHVASYDLAELSKQVDFINVVRTYELHSYNQKLTGHFSNSNTSYPYNVEKAIDVLIEKGADASKLVLGISFQAKTSKLKEECDSGIGKETTGEGGEPGEYTQTSGVLAYYEVCSVRWSNRVCTSKSSAKAPYGVSGSDFIAYDDEESIATKVYTLVIGKKLKGVMFWTLEFDDFTGTQCRGPKYPLVKAAINTLKGDPVTPKCHNVNNCLKPTIPRDKFYRICYFTNWAQYRTCLLYTSPSPRDS